MDLETANTFRLLEESLWRMETRHDLLLMRQTFAHDVVEFGQSGRIYTLEDLLPEQNICADHIFKRAVYQW